MKRTEDLNIDTFTPIISPENLKKDLPLTDKISEVVSDTRKDIENIINGTDKRMIAIVGPCSIHDPKAAMDYAVRLNELREKYQDKLLILMRVYFEKPRTTIGWRGLITDPDLDNSYNIQKGIVLARKIMCDINAIGLPIASEMLDPIVPQYISDLISWAAIGARTTESQTHREISSGLSMPVGFKNGTDGNSQTAINGLISARYHHSFIGIDQHGRTSILNTKGNKYSHLILRGGNKGPNYHEEDIEAAEKNLLASNIKPAIIIDCSHSNSGKKSCKQARVLRSILSQRLFGRESIIGFMLESNLFPGNQKIVKGTQGLKYGISITDECIGWDETEVLIRKVAESL